MHPKSLSLCAEKNLHVTEQRDGSLTIVQESNDVRDTQQVVVLTAEQWQFVRHIRNVLISK